MPITNSRDISFSGTVSEVFEIRGRGTVLLFELDFKGKVCAGSWIAIELQNGKRIAKEVRSVDIADDIREKKARLGLVVTGLMPTEIKVGATISACPPPTKKNFLRTPKTNK